MALKFLENHLKNEDFLVRSAGFRVDLKTRDVPLSLPAKFVEHGDGVPVFPGNRGEFLKLYPLAGILLLILLASSQSSLIQLHFQLVGLEKASPVSAQSIPGLPAILFQDFLAGAVGYWRRFDQLPFSSVG